MLLDLIDLSKLRRAIVYGLLLSVVLILQNLLVSRITLFGIHAMLVPALVVAVGLFEGGVWGGFVGLAAGYFTDMSYTDHVVLFTILLPTLGFFIGALGKYMLQKGLVSYLVMAFLALAVIAFCQMFHTLFLSGVDARAFRRLYFHGTYTWIVVRTGLIQTLWSLVWSVPIYLPCKLIAARPMGR